MILKEGNPISITTNQLETPATIVPATDPQEAADYWVSSKEITEFKKIQGQILGNVAREKSRQKMHAVIETTAIPINSTI